MQPRLCRGCFFDKKFKNGNFYLVNLKVCFRFARMIVRKSVAKISQLLEEFPAVAILGPRQVGKTTLARRIAEQFKPKTLFLDLETQEDLIKITDPAAYFELHKGSLIILDEVQRVPHIFTALRGIIDKRRQEGLRAHQFLLLGSSSLELLQQSSESLAGRIALHELPIIHADEIDTEKTDLNQLWLRGGFPDSLLAASDAGSFRWRSNFISTYLERDIPQLGPRIPAITLRRLWTMLAHNQGSILNVTQLGGNLDLTGPTAKKYVGLLEDLLLIRTVHPWLGNVGKRLVKSPKVYIKDSGLTHALLNIKTIDDLLSHPIAGQSWEGFVVDAIISNLPEGWSAWYYRTGAGAEIDLVLESGYKDTIAIEIKRAYAPKVSKGFYIGCEDIKATEKIVVYPGNESFPLSNEIMVHSVTGIIQRLESF